MAAIATLVADTTLCGHVTHQKIELRDDGGMVLCGTCYQAYRRLQERFTAGELDAAGLAAGLEAVVRTYDPVPSASDIASAVAEAVADFEETARAA